MKNFYTENDKVVNFVQLKKVVSGSNDLDIKNMN
jgi:hypothetical protein